MSDEYSDDDKLAVLLGDWTSGCLEAEEIFADAELAGYADALADYYLAESPVAELPVGLRGSVMAAVGELAERGVEAKADGRGRLGREEIREIPRVVSGGAGRGWYPLIPWALAACFAAIAAVTARQVTELRKSVGEVRGQLERRDAEAGKLVAALLEEELPGNGAVTVLEPQGEGRERAVAVWDGEAQEVTLHVSGLPPLDETVSDYQLWIVDPQYEVPVDGGIFQVSETGSVRHTFRAPLKVDSVAAFAVTKEVAGGVEVSAGPHLLLGAVGG